MLLKVQSGKATEKLRVVEREKERGEVRDSVYSWLA